MFMRVFIIVTILASCVNAEEQKPMNWGELTEQFECPAWYRDAKFGIWAHWGAQSKPARGGGWYARHMYYSKDRGMPRHEDFGREAYEYHRKTYGHPSEKGFKDVIHEWKAEKLDTDALTLTVPADRPTTYTTVFKLVGKTINAEHPNDALKKAEKSE